MTYNPHTDRNECYWCGLPLKAVRSNHEDVCPEAFQPGEVYLAFDSEGKEKQRIAGEHPAEPSTE